MRRLLVLALIVVLVGLGSIDAAGAAPPSINRRVSGPFSGNSVFDFSTHGCNFVYQQHEATYTIAKGTSGSFHLQGCVDFAPNGFSYTGTFVLTTPKGGVLTGTVNGTVAAEGPTGPCLPTDFPAPLNFTLTMTHGTAGFTRATGSIQLLGTWCSRINSTGMLGGPIFGALTGHIRR